MIELTEEAVMGALRRSREDQERIIKEVELDGSQS